MNDPQPEGHMASHIGRRKFLATPQLMRDRVREHDARRGVQAWIRGYCVTRRQRDNLRAPAGKNRVGTDQQCTAGLLHEVCEGRIDLATSPSAKDFDWTSKRRSARL